MTSHDSPAVVRLSRFADIVAALTFVLILSTVAASIIFPLPDWAWHTDAFPFSAIKHDYLTADHPVWDACTQTYWPGEPPPLKKQYVTNISASQSGVVDMGKVLQDALNEPGPPCSTHKILLPMGKIPIFKSLHVPPDHRVIFVPNPEKGTQLVPMTQGMAVFEGMPVKN